MKKLKVMLFGWTGVANTGSEAKLLVSIQDVKDVIGERLEQMDVLSVGPVDERRYVKDPNIRILSVFPIIPDGLMNLYRMVFEEKYDILFLCEGSTFLDKYNDGFLWAFLLAARLQHLRGRKTVSYSNDCDRLRPYNQVAAANTLNKCIDLIMVRNPDAKRRMQQFGVTKEIHVTADGAYRYPLPPKEYREKLLKDLKLGDRPIISIATKDFFTAIPVIPKLFPKEGYLPFSHLWRKELGYGPMISKDVYLPNIYLQMTKERVQALEKYNEAMSRYADYLVEKFDANVLLIGMASWELDGVNAKQVYDMMEHKDAARWIPSHIYDVDAIKSLLCESKYLITTRYHASVLSSSAGVPMIAISSDARLEAVFRELDIMDFYIPVETGPPPKLPENLYDLLVEKTNKLVEREDELRRRILEADKRFVERSLQNKLLLKEWFEKNFGG